MSAIPQPCPRGEVSKPEPSCTNRHQCWEPCGELGKSEKHARIHRVALTDEIKASLSVTRDVSIPGSAEPNLDDLYIQIGKAMVEMTTTVRGPDEWLAIPELWRLCAEERDRLRAAAPLPPAETVGEPLSMSMFASKADYDAAVERDAFIAHFKKVNPLWQFQDDAMLDAADDAAPSSPNGGEAGDAQFYRFRTWAEEEGRDIAHTYDTDRSRWVFLNPMTADLWQAWQAAAGVKEVDRG